MPSYSQMLLFRIKQGIEQETFSIWNNAVGGIGQNISSTISGSLSNVAMMGKGRSVTITGKGSKGVVNDIWESRDSFFFSSVNIPGTEIGNIFSVQIYSAAGFVANSTAHDWRKFGLMVRDDLDPSSKHFSVLLTQRRGIHVFSRSTHGGKTTMGTEGNITFSGGGWLRIDRAGDQYRAFYRSEEESSYIPIGSATISMSESVEVGVAISPHSDESCSVTFSLFDMKVCSMFVIRC